MSSTTSPGSPSSLAFTDVDLSDTHTVSKSGPAFNWLDSHGNVMNLTVAQTNALNTLAAASTFTPTLNDSTGTGQGSIDFSYSVADNYFDFLAACETLRRPDSSQTLALSLGGGFLAAGADDVIGTLAAIGDQDAHRIFYSIHRRLAAGVDAAEAVRRAQIEALSLHPTNRTGRVR